MDTYVKMPELDAATMAWIEAEAARSGEPVGNVVRRLIYRGLETERAAQPVVHHDLDDLAGTWSEEEAAEFRRISDEFNRVDPTIWQ